MKTNTFASILAQEFVQWTNRLLLGLIIMGGASAAAIATVTLYAMEEHAYTWYAGLCFRIFIFTTASAIAFALMAIAAFIIQEKTGAAGRSARAGPAGSNGQSRRAPRRHPPL